MLPVSDGQHNGPPLERSSHATFRRSAAGTPALLHANNSTTTCEAITAKIKCDLQVATGCSFDSLKTHAEIGAGLNQLKCIIPHGDFGRYVETHLRLKKQWRVRLMKLAAEWTDVLKAFEWAGAMGLMIRSEFSVDGALALLGKWRQRDVEDQSQPPKRPSHQSPRESKSVTLLEVLFFTLGELERARAQIRFLEAELERLNGGNVINLSAADVISECDGSDFSDHARMSR
jgi:hypothetical protein